MSTLKILSGTTVKAFAGALANHLAKKSIQFCDANFQTLRFNDMISLDQNLLTLASVVIALTSVLIAYKQAFPFKKMLLLV